MTLPAPDQLKSQTVPHVTRAKLIEFYNALSIAGNRYRDLGMMKKPIDLGKQVEASAELRMARDAWIYARHRFNRAFEAWIDGGYQE